MFAGVYSIAFFPHGAAVSAAAKRGDGATLVLGEFVAGPENRVVTATIEALVGGEAKFNPVVFYGPIGVGKSLIAYGLASHWKQQRALSTIVTAGTDFAREFANSLETKSVEDFRERYRNADAIVVDDLHRITSKPAAQQEFISQSDVWIENGTLVVATLSDSPTAAGDMAAGLASRLSSGLTVPIAPPGSETKKAIVARLADRHHVQLPPSVVRLLTDDAEHAAIRLQTVPQLNHAILQLKTSGVLDDTEVDDETILESLLGDENHANEKLDLPSIAKLVSKYFELKPADLKSASRQQRIVRARGVAMLLARRMTECSLQKIGRQFGNRDHTTVMHACRKTETLSLSDPAIRQAINDLTKLLTSP